MFSPSLTLNTGASMPVVGLGTWKSAPRKVGEAVEYAILECGYRHIDCASIYGNQKEIGDSLERIWSRKKVARDEIFITSKLWNNFHAALDVEKACKETLSDLKLDYLDLYLVHWGIATPATLGSEPLDAGGRLVTAKIPVAETWKAMEQLVSAGLVKAIGVSNFTGVMLADVLTYAAVRPAMNQVELHPYNAQPRLLDYCAAEGIAVTAYSPLGSSGNIHGHASALHLRDDKLLLDLAKIYHKSVTQLLLRWGIERSTVVIPKSTTPKNIREHFNVFDFELSKKDIERLSALDKKHRYCDPWYWWRIPYFD